MPNKEFLETYPLYRKFTDTDARVPNVVGALQSPALNMFCKQCKSNQTFRMANRYTELSGKVDSWVEGIFRSQYICTHCSQSQRIFFFLADRNENYYMKVGQYPSWEINSDSNLEKLLGKYADNYKKGLVCESQSYGIGAYGYYRRIVENIIDQLLDEIPALLTGTELSLYQEALKKTKTTTVTKEKIDLVKDLLPPILRPEGMNPLAVLHTTLSEGIHALTDEACLAKAAIIREAMLFLVHRISETTSQSKEFTAGMRKLLDMKTPTTGKKE